MLRLNRLVLNDMLEEGKEIVYYPYRSAAVKGALFSFKAETPEEREDFEKIQEHLSKKATHVFKNGGTRPVEGEVTPDNHTCFRVGSYAVMFSDWTMSIGTDLILRNW